MKIFTAVSLILLCVSAQAQFLVEGDDLRASSRADLNSYSNSGEFNEERRMGLGIMVAGPMGFIGTQMQLNLFQDFGVVLGYGATSTFKAFNMEFRDYLSSGQFNPFWSVGYARWMGRGKDASSTSPQFLADDFLNGRERQTGEFNENILYPGFGLQWFNLAGEWAGLSVLAEVMYLVDTEDLIAKPTAGISTMYFF